MARLAPEITAEIALRRFATPPRPRLPPAVPAGGEPLELWLDGARVAGFTAGKGPLVALLHGWGGQAAQFESLVGPLVAAGFRVAALDAPAHGASSGRRSSLPQFARALEALARAEGTPAAIVAHSLGAAAATLAIASGLAIERAVFFAPVCDPRRHFERHAEAWGVDTAALFRIAERRFGARSEDLRLTERARRLDVPLLIFHDEGDRAVSLDESRLLAEHWPAAELRVTRGLGHVRLLADPASIAGAVAFLRVIPARAGSLLGCSPEL